MVNLFPSLPGNETENPNEEEEESKVPSNVSLLVVCPDEDVEWWRLRAGRGSGSLMRDVDRSTISSDIDHIPDDCSSFGFFRVCVFTQDTQDSDITRPLDQTEMSSTSEDVSVTDGDVLIKPKTHISSNPL